METGVSWVMVIISLCVVLYITHQVVLTSLYWFFAALAQGTFGVLDHYFLADLLPAAPWFVWLCWGAVIGAAGGLWMQAPLYGWRKYRPFIIAAPFLLIGVLFLLRLLIPHGG